MIDFHKQIGAIEQGFDVAHHAIEDTAEVALSSRDPAIVIAAKAQVARLMEIISHWQEQTEILAQQIVEAGDDIEAATEEAA
ncbi:MAG: hypothetical protein V7629_17285 [Motiliproteus sp.]